MASYDLLHLSRCYPKGSRLEGNLPKHITLPRVDIPFKFPLCCLRNFVLLGL
ncbi:hypothetical protein Mapa_018814 [Marchantia paleacea]|nr:hypothetical protein Mapa_018814 [Marchantia paleacea]